MPIEKILFVVFSLRGGGAERVVTKLSETLSERRQVIVAQLSDKEPFFALHNGVRLHRYRGPQSGILRYLGLFRYLYRIFRTELPDVTVSFGETISPFVVVVGRIAGQKVIVSNRASPLSSLHGRRAWLNPVVFPFAEAVLVQTERAVQILSKRFRACRWLVLQNPLDIPAYVPADSQRRNVCMTVGWLGGEKNQQAVILAFARHAPPEWELWIAGDGPARESLQTIAQERNIAHQVKFLGEIKNVPALLMQARVFAFASRTEGFPNALAEAMACGCACIAYDCMTGPSDLISHEESGLLIQLDDQEEFNNGLRRLLTSPTLRANLSSKARARTQALDKHHVACRFLDAVSALRQTT